MIKTFTITTHESPRAEIVGRVGKVLESEIVYSVPGNIVKGCALGHMQALRKSLSYGSCIILEDDADFVTDSILPSLEDLPADADALYLGLSRFGYDGNANCRAKYKIVDGKYVKVESMLATHAILYLSDRYKRHSLRIVSEAYRSEFPIDVALASHMTEFNVYALRQPTFYQNCEKHSRLTKISI